MSLLNFQVSYAELLNKCNTIKVQYEKLKEQTDQQVDGTASQVAQFAKKYQEHEEAHFRCNSISYQMSRAEEGIKRLIRGKDPENNTYLYKLDPFVRTHFESKGFTFVKEGDYWRIKL